MQIRKQKKQNKNQKKKKNEQQQTGHGTWQCGGLIRVSSGQIKHEQTEGTQSTHKCTGETQLSWSVMYSSKNARFLEK